MFRNKVFLIGYMTLNKTLKNKEKGNNNNNNNLKLITLIIIFEYGWYVWNLKIQIE